MADETQALSRRVFLKTCGAMGAVALVGAASLISGCTGELTTTGEAIYTIIAVKGATLTESDLTSGRYKYKQKCSSCGWQSFFATSVDGIGVTDEFKCPRCGFHQKVEISVTSKS